MMTVQGTHFGGAHIIKDDNNNNSINEKIEIEVTTFDLWLKDNSISQVHFYTVELIT